MTPSGHQIGARFHVVLFNLSSSPIPYLSGTGMGAPLSIRYPTVRVSKRPCDLALRRQLSCQPARKARIAADQI